MLYGVYACVSAAGGSQHAASIVACEAVAP